MGWQGRQGWGVGRGSKAKIPERGGGVGGRGVQNDAERVFWKRRVEKKGFRRGSKGHRDGG